MKVEQERSGLGRRVAGMKARGARASRGYGTAWELCREDYAANQPVPPAGDPMRYPRVDDECFRGDGTVMKFGC